MSLVRPVEVSSNSYRNRKLYPSNESDNSSEFSAQQRTLYGSDSYSAESSEKYSLESPSDSGNSSTRLLGPTFESEYLDSESPEQGAFDEEVMRVKLRELERALLVEDEETEMEIEISEESCSPKKLLVECAGAISDGSLAEASAMIEELRQKVSIQGEPSQRIAAYMTEGLAARIASSGKFLYEALKCKEPPSSERLAAMQILFEVCPCFKFGFTAANGAMLEAFEGENRVHIVDFDVNQGSQYMTLIQAMAGRRSGADPPRVRLTGVDDPESVQRPVGGLRVVGQRLEKLAETLGVAFEFRAVEARSSAVEPAMLGCGPAEALVVNFAFQLHHVPDESVSTVNERDRLLRMVRGLGPKLVTVVEQDVNTNTAPFFPRFLEAYAYYSAVFESLDATLPRDSHDRANVERHCLARDIVNVVACEGEDRIERYEVAGKWRARMAMAGFSASPIPSRVSAEIAALVRRHYCRKYTIKEEFGALHFGWEDKNLIVASAWK